MQIGVSRTLSIVLPAMISVITLGCSSHDTGISEGESVASTQQALVSNPKNINYGGYQACFNAGSYYLSDLIGHGSSNDSISSVVAA